MMDGAPRPSSGSAPAASDSRRRALLAAASIEISPRDELAGDRLGDHLPPGRTVFVNHSGSVTHHDIVAACKRLKRAGFTPVPHIAARRLASFTQADDFLRRAAGEAAVGGVLLIGGDPAQPVGPFRDSLSLLASGVLERHGVGRVGLAGYPEGHPAIGAHALAAALTDKVALARRRGLEVGVITQFGFEAAPIRRWIEALRRSGIDCPVTVGVAGPASIATLAKFAVRCGIGASLRALARGHAAFARMLTEAGPDGLIEALTEGGGPGGEIAGLHVFTFGGVSRAAEWLRAQQ